MEMFVLDALMGSGKTSCVHQLMKEHADAGHDEIRWIYIAPFLEELSRIRSVLPELNFQLPSDPDKPEHGKVFHDFIRLVSEGHNIAATHSAFKMFNDILYREVDKHNYCLVIDETLPVIEKYQGCTKNDFDMLLKTEQVRIAKDHRIEWNHDKTYSGKHENVRRDCDAGVLVSVGGSILIWRFPAKFLDAFQEIYVCTYLFEGSLMANYLKAHGREYELLSVACRDEGGTKTYWPIPYDGMDNLPTKQELAKLITICDDKALNAIGDGERADQERGRKRQPLSHNWFVTEAMTSPVTVHGIPRGLGLLKRNLATWFRYRSPAPAEAIMWTTFGGAGARQIINKLKGPGYAKSFVNHTAKATNQYRERYSLAYLLNKFLDVDVANYFKANNLTAREDLFALGELVQWIFRSRIRENKPISIYIPSERMRRLLTQWLSNSDRAIVYDYVIDPSNQITRSPSSMKPVSARKQAYIDRRRCIKENRESAKHGNQLETVVEQDASRFLEAAIPVEEVQIPLFDSTGDRIGTFPKDSYWYSPISQPSEK